MTQINCPHSGDGWCWDCVQNAILDEREACVRVIQDYIHTDDLSKLEFVVRMIRERNNGTI